MLAYNPKTTSRLLIEKAIMDSAGIDFDRAEKVTDAVYAAMLQLSDSSAALEIKHSLEQTPDDYREAYRAAMWDIFSLV